MKAETYDRLTKKTFIKRGWFKLGPGSWNYIEVTLRGNYIELSTPGGKLVIHPYVTNVIQVEVNGN